METKRFMTWLMLAAIAVPQSAFAAHAPADAPLREALSARELASFRGGSMPATKIGATAEYGNLGVYRKVAGTRFCGVASSSSAPILPTTGGRQQCNASIPTHSFVDDSVDVKIGGMAAVLHGSTNPTISVYVNGVNVPAAQLGSEFQAQCPFDGNASADGATLDRYNCSSGGGYNWANIPVSYFHGGLNTITVYYQLAQAAFQDAGSDIDTRIIMMQ